MFITPVLNETRGRGAELWDFYDHEARAHGSVLGPIFVLGDVVGGAGYGGIVTRGERRSGCRWLAPWLE